MASREAKLRKLNEFRRKRPHISAKALADTLQGVKDDGMPELHDRNHLRQARDLVASQHTPFGPMIQEIDVSLSDGSRRKLPFAFPAALLYVALMSSVALNALFATRMDDIPPSPEHPWNLILYSDEVTPGSVLSPNNARKFQALYFSFLELGPYALSREESWFPLMTEYSKVVNEVEASLSQVFGAIIKSIFNPEYFDLQTAGINLPIGDGRRLWAKLGVFLQDGAAHQMMWSARTGMSRMCLLCANVFTEKSELVAEDGSSLLKCNIVHEKDLVFATDDSLRMDARYLEGKAGTMNKQKFDKLQQALGITHRPGSLLLDRDLYHIIKPSEQYMHDWMHTLFANGIVNTMVFLLFEAFIDEDRRTYKLVKQGSYTVAFYMLVFL